MADVVAGKRTRYLDLLRSAAALVAGAAIFINGAEKVQRQWELSFSGQLAFLDALSPIVLFVIIVVYGLAWYVSATYEFGLFERYYGDVAPERPLSSILASIFVPAVLVVMAYFADNIGVFAAVFCAYIAVNALARSAVQNAVRSMLSDGGAVAKKVSDEFALYYLKRPFQLLNLLMFVAGIFAAWLVYVSSLQPVVIEGVPVDRTTFAYASIVAALLVAELVTWLWRWRLYSRVGG